MRPTPLVSADQVAAVVEAYLDRMADFARRFGVPAGTVAAVLQRSGLAMIDACADSPEAVVDMVGRWAADTRTLATRLRQSGQVAARRGKQADAEAGVVAGGAEAKATARALAGLDERRRMALLLRDSYDAPPVAVAVALGVTDGEAQDIVAEARLRLFEEVTKRDAPSMRGHVPVPGLGLGELGALADGSDSEDQQIRLLRRHVGSCETCAAVLDAQTKARMAMSGLPVLALPDAEREPLLRTLLERADQGLPTAAEVIEIESRPPRIFPRFTVAGALLGAVALGAVIGLIVNAVDTKSTPPPTPSPTSLDIGQASDSATPTTSVSPTATVTQTPTSTVTTAPAVIATTPSVVATKSKKPTKKPTATATATVTRTSSPTASSSPTAVESSQATQASISVSPSNVSAGGSVTVSGSGFTPGHTVSVRSSEPGVAPATATVGDGGGFTVTLTAPSGGILGSGGTYTVTATDTQSGQSASGSYTVS